MDKFTLLAEGLIELYDDNIQPFLVSAFMKSCRIYNNINSTCANWYCSSEVVRTIVDETWYQSSRIYSFLIHSRMEPRQSFWLITAWLSDNDTSLTNYYNYNEDLHPFSSLSKSFFFDNLYDFPTKNLSLYSRRYIESACNNSLESYRNVALNPIFVMKTVSPSTTRPVYMVRQVKPTFDQLDYTKSSVKFMSIEYIHPEMLEAIEIKLDDGFYVVGNELFTPTFVMRLLEYQSRSYCFDSRYKVRIMDSECNMIDIGCDSYCVLAAEDYTIIVNETENEDNDKEQEEEEDTEDKDTEDTDEDEHEKKVHYTSKESLNLTDLYNPNEFGRRHNYTI